MASSLSIWLCYFIAPQIDKFNFCTLTLKYWKVIYLIWLTLKPISNREV